MNEQAHAVDRRAMVAEEEDLGGSAARYGTVSHSRKPV